MRIGDFGGVKTPDLTKLKETVKYESLRNKGISILICTPTLDSKVRIEYTNSLLETCIKLHDLGIPFVFCQNKNSCFVDLARNLFVTQFMKSNMTHLLQIDSDMSWNADAVLEMLMKDKEFIAGIGRKKTEEIEFAGINYTDAEGTIKGEKGKTDEDVLIKMK